MKEDHVILDILQRLAQFAFTAVRHALFGGHDWIGPLLALAGVGAITIAVSLALFELALRHAVRRGTLNQY